MASVFLYKPTTNNYDYNNCGICAVGWLFSPSSPLTAPFVFIVSHLVHNIANNNNVEKT